MEYKCPEKIHYINSWFILPLNKWILYDSHTMTFVVYIHLKPKTHLERLFASMNQLMSLEFGTFDKRFSTFGAHVDTRSVCMQMLPHCRVVSEHF